MPDSVRRQIVRFAFCELYNRFAFTYDAVSAVVSRGEWRAWTRAALPYLRGTRILEIAFGTGNLQLDLYDAGCVPFGVDLSPNMAQIARAKFRRQKPEIVPRLARADVRALPFPDAFFSSLIMTFPPGFMYNPAAVAELHRVLAPEGVLLWVDAAYLYPRDAWSRFLDWAFTITGTTGSPDERRALLKEHLAEDTLPQWDWHVERVDTPTSRVHVFIARKRRAMQ